MKGDLVNPLVSINEGEYHIDVSEIVVLRKGDKLNSFTITFKTGKDLTISLSNGVATGMAYSSVLKTLVAYKKFISENI